MTTLTIRLGSIVRGLLLPEPIEAIAIVPMGSSLVRSIDGQIAHGDTFHNVRYPDLKADYFTHHLAPSGGSGARTVPRGSGSRRLRGDGQRRVAGQLESEYQHGSR